MAVGVLKAWRGKLNVNGVTGEKLHDELVKLEEDGDVKVDNMKSLQVLNLAIHLGM